MEPKVEIGLEKLNFVKTMVGKFLVGEEQIIQEVKLVLNGSQVLLKQKNTGYPR